MLSMHSMQCSNRHAAYGSPAVAAGKQTNGDKPQQWRSSELQKLESGKWRRSVLSVRLNGRLSGDCRDPLLSELKALSP